MASCQAKSFHLHLAVVGCFHEVCISQTGDLILFVWLEVEYLTPARLIQA
jgi:hypothetical protein